MRSAGVPETKTADSITIYMTKAKKKPTKKPQKKTAKKVAGPSATAAEPDGSKAQELEDRRAKVESYKLQGFLHSQIAGILSVSERTVESDVQAIREKHAANFRGSINADAEAAMILAKYEKIQSTLWTTYAAGAKGQETMKVQAMAATAAVLRDQVKMLQALGRLPKDLDDLPAAPVNVYFDIKRPDRSSQLKKQTDGSRATK